MPDLAISSSSRYRFGRHDRIVISDTAYCPASTDKAGHLFRRYDDLHLTEHFSHEKIAELIGSGDLVCHRDFYRSARARLRTDGRIPLLSELTPEEQSKVLWRQSYCDQFLRMEHADRHVSRSDAAMRAAIAAIAGEIAKTEAVRQNPNQRCGSVVTQFVRPSPSCLRVWLKNYEASDYDPLALRDRYGRSGNRRPRLSPESVAFAQEFVERYASNSRPTKAMVFEEYVAAFERAKQTGEDAHPTMMSARSFEKRIAKLDPVYVYTAREGEEAARKKFNVVWGGLDVTRPLERVEFDEWCVSLQTLLLDAGIWRHLSPEQRKAAERTRAWLSAGICCATRCVVALRLLAAPPSVDSALAALEMMVSDKTHIGTWLDLQTPWDQHGVMETLAMDSGSAFIATQTQAAIRDLGVEPLYPPAKLPQMRGRIERLFRTFGQHFVRYFPGQTFENILKKGDYDSEANACLDLEELNRSLVAYVVDAYHNTPHDGLAGETPRNAWLRLTAKYGVLPPPDSLTRRHIFGIPYERRIQNRGIRVFGIHYQSLALQQLRRTVGQKPVLVRIDRFDLGQISVRTPEGWLSVPPAIDGLDLSGVSCWEWIAAAENLRRKHADAAALSSDTVRAALARIRETAEMAEKRAELASPVMTAEEFERIERRIFIDFGVRDGVDGMEGEILGSELTDSDRNGTDEESDAQPKPAEDDWFTDH